MTTIGAI